MNRHSRVGLCLCIALLSGIAFGQVRPSQPSQTKTIRISGKVADITGEAIPNAEVKIKASGGSGPEITTKTDLHGSFVLTPVASKEYALDIRMPGFKILHRTIQEDIKASVELGTITLEVAPTDLEGQYIVPPVDLIASPVTAELLPIAGRPDGPVHTTICELIKDPQRFNGKMVQLRATIRSGFEVSLLRDDSCSASIWFAGPDATYTTVGRTSTSSPPVVVRQDDEYRKMNSFLMKEYKAKKGSLCVGCPLYTVTATVTGRFDHVSKDGVDAKARMMIGFGHLNTYESQLVLESVSEVEAKPIDPSVYEKR